MTAAELLSVAAFLEDKYSQAYPMFGSERTGAPVVAFCRFACEPIRLREPIVEPDALIVQDPTLLHEVDLFGGVGPDAFVLVNTSRSPEELGIGAVVRRLRPERVVTVPATEIAREHLGRPLPNAALLGAFSALTGELGIASVAGAIRDRFSGRVGEANEGAARAAYEIVAAGAGEAILHA